jgi:hypothetical protein
MRALIIITILFSGCKFETKEQKLERMRKDSCDLAHRYLNECAYERKGVRIAPFAVCSQSYADQILSYPCDVLVENLK